jgi:nucleolar protein 6
MNAADKLTKKQKKTLAFRERKTGKRKDHNASSMDAQDSNDVPAMEDQDMADAQGDQLEVEMEERSEKGWSSLDNGKRKAKEKDRDEQTVEKPKKRQREGEETTVQKGREAKRAKVLDDTGETHEKKVAKTQRFLLFVGMSLSVQVLAF